MSDESSYPPIRSHPPYPLRLSALSASAAALKQLADRDYAGALRDGGADPTHNIAVVFARKRVHVEVEPANGDDRTP